MRVVVDLVGEPTHGLLAESRFVKRSFLPGGEHNMYELAFAAAQIGLDVELRGWLDRPAFERLAQGTGAAPRVELPARKPEHDDLVVVPEGWQNPLDYARLLLSPARLAMFVLAPPGLFGWPFTAPGWTRPDPVTVPLESVAKRAHFRAIDQLGIALLTHSPGLAKAAEEAGVPCAFVGTGRPDPPTTSADEARPVDVAALLSNRWAPLVEQVVPELRGMEIDLIGESTNEEVLDRLRRAKVLLWPSRIEGHATVPWEARAVGCVPVALSTNRFAVGLADESGAVLVDRVDQLADAVRGLLADEQRLGELSARARRSASAEVDWESYVRRVRSFFESLPPAGPERPAAAAMGAALDGWIDQLRSEAQASLEELAAEERRIREDRDRLHAKVGELRAEEQRLRADRDTIQQSLIELRNRRAVRIALRVDALREKRDP